MTNEEIRNIPNQKLNEMVTRIVKGAQTHKIDGDGVVLYQMDNSAPGGIDQIFVEDYCSDAGLMLPLALSNGISIQCGMLGDFRAIKSPHSWEDRNYCRAAAIVFLKSRGVL